VVGVEALRRGRDPIPPALEELRRSAGARRGIWLAARGEAPAAISEAGRPPRRDEVPASLPGRWWHTIRPGQLRFLGAGELRREQRARADGLAEALILCTEAGRLWLDAPVSLTLDPTREITELLALDRLEELRLSSASSARREALAHMGERAAGLAHDLRNQLSLALLECRRREVESADTSAGLDEALESARRLCEDFLAGKGETVRRQATRVADVLREEAVATARISGREGEVAVALRCRSDLLFSIDDKLLRRIARNLLLNAIAASHRGGRVRLEASEGDGGGLELIVTDEGCGMDRTELEAMLRPGHTRSGTGYGTSSLLDCVAQLDGELEIESEVGRGTRAVVRCRCADCQSR